MKTQVYPYRNADNGKVEFFTAVNGQGTKIDRSPVSALLDNGAIGYFNRDDLTTAELQAIKVETAERYYLDRRAPNKKGKVVVKHGLLSRYIDLLDNMTKKAKSNACTINQDMAKGMLAVMASKLQEFEQAVFAVKTEKVKEERMITLADILR